MTTINAVCSLSGKGFLIDDQDQAYYQNMAVPLPTLFPQERQRRRMCWRNERTLYHRACDLCKKPVLSMYHPQSQFQVYCNPCFWGEKWNGLDYGREIAFSRPFFDQVADLMKVVPRINLCNDSASVNCDYVNQTTHIKDSYLVFDTDNCEKTYYVHLGKYCISSMDCLRAFNCELCSECVDCTRCYNLHFSQDCENCQDSYFLKNCKNCKNCFGCVNLQNKEYYYFNQPLTKEQYEAKIVEWKNLSALQQADLEKKIRNWFSTAFVKENHNLATENVLGDYLMNAKDCAYCFDCMDIQDSRYCSNMTEGVRDCYDYEVWGVNATRVYECITVGENAFNVRFSLDSWANVSDLTYSQLCLHSANLFGCIGLKKNQYCILNKQYSREEYEALLPKLIEHMKNNGEWGEFFPISMSPFAYNETVAQAYYPLSKEQTLQLGYRWRDSEDVYANQEATAVLPAMLRDTPDSITNEILKCEVTGKLYKIIPQELVFHRQIGSALPRKCPEQRHQERMALRNPRTIWARQCSQCAKNIYTTYAPDRPEKVYCEECYLKVVY